MSLASNTRTGAGGEKDAPRPAGWETDYSLEDGWGANSVRASYYPLTPSLYAGEKAEAGDALGLAGFTLASCRKPPMNYWTLFGLIADEVIREIPPTTAVCARGLPVRVQH